MEKYRTLLLIFLVVFQSCLSQKTSDSDFIYQRSFFENNILVENYAYNSKTGIYEYQLINPGYEKKIKKIEIVLSENAKDEIYSLYIKLKPKELSNCMYEKGLKTYHSSIEFINKSSSSSCNSNLKDEMNYKLIEDKLYNYLSSSPIYQKEFPNEFITK